jgi:hypothetical protein
MELFGVTRFFYPSYLILSGWNTLIGHFPGHYCVLCFKGLEGKWLADGLDTTSDAKRASQDILIIARPLEAGTRFATPIWGDFRFAPYDKPILYREFKAERAC